MDSGRKESSMLLSGQNNYSTALQVYAKLYKVSQPRITKAIADVLSTNSEDKQCFSIADFGTADAVMAIPTINLIIDAIRRHSGEHKEILLVFEEQPSSDFNALTKNLNAATEANNGTPKLHLDDSIRVMISGTSMYRPCMISGTLDFGICFTALHWLSKRATTISNGITFLHANSEELKIIRRQSKMDWVEFLLSRTKDLARGGQLLISCCATNEAGESSNYGDPHNEFLSYPLFKMRDKGVITETEFCNINFDWYLRTKEEFEEPFKNGTVDQLNLLSIDFENIELISPLNFIDKEDPTKRKNHADIITSGIRAFSYNSVVGGLLASRSTVEKSRIVDMYYHFLNDILQSKERNAKFQFVKADVVVQKKFLKQDYTKTNV